MKLLLAGLLLVWFSAVAAQQDDGFIWIDANTRIKVKPIAAGGGSTAPEKAPEPKKDPKEKEKK